MLLSIDPRVLLRVVKWVYLLGVFSDSQQFHSVWSQSWLLLQYLVLLIYHIGSLAVFVVDRELVHCRQVKHANWTSNEP